MTAPSTRLRALLLLALVGVLVMVGLVVQALAGLPGVVVLALVAGPLVVLGARRGRAAFAPEALPAGRTCTCCTATHFDPVEIV